MNPSTIERQGKGERERDRKNETENERYTKNALR